MKKLFSLVIIFLILFLIIRGWWSSQLAPSSKEENIKTVIIPKGKSADQIAEQLKKEGLIKSESAFSLYVKMQGLSSKLSAGTFKLSASMSIPQVAKALSGIPSETWVTLLEGWRLEEMADELSSKFQVTSYKFIEVAEEGYMFPDTYLFPNDVTLEQIVKVMRDNFDKKFSEDLKSKIRAQGLTDDEGIILASIVEREARSDGVRKMVASILLKRLKIGMGLNADATIQYALGYQQDEKLWWKRHLSREDLKVESPYNTYLYKGLSPAPICNPSLSSLQAVADADPNVPYLYYYHDSKGNSYYGKTLEEHNANVANNP